MKKLIRWKLHMLARWCIRRHHPIVIGVTGSFGKTTARNIITEILRKAGKDVWTPEGNYNGEWGLPMAILQVRSPGKNIVGWIGVFFFGLVTILRKRYPSILVLEYGIDHIGEMELQTRIVEPDIALFTTLAPAHLIGFSSAEEYFGEKGKLLSRKIKKTFAIGNADDPHQKNFSCDMWYGKNPVSDCVMGDIVESIRGIEGNITIKAQSHAYRQAGTKQKAQNVSEEKKYHLVSPILGAHHMGLLVGAFLVAQKIGIAPEKIFHSISDIHLPHGRGNILRGMRESVIIDGTYNGGFIPIVAGTKMLVELAQKEQRKTIALLGDMRELGPLETIRHEELWENISALSIDYIVFVGKICDEIIRPLAQNNAKTNTFFTQDAREAGKYIKKILENDSEKYFIFAKGSQNTIYLEEALKYIISPEEVSQLVRQDKKYLQKKQQFFHENF